MRRGLSATTATTSTRAWVVGVLGVLSASAALAGPWKVETGDVYFQLSAARLMADRLADGNGDERDIPNFTQDELAIYSAFGFGDRWTGIVRAPLLRRSELDEFGSASGVGDLQVGLQGQLAERGPWRLAARVIVQVPTGDEESGQGALPTGTGVWEAEAWGSLGRSFGRNGWGWGFVELGHLSRGEGLVDGVLYRAELGHRVGAQGRWRAALRVWGVEPYEDPSRSPSSSAAGLGDDVAYLAFGPSLSRELRGGWALEAAIDAAATARNVALGPTVRLGVVYSGKLTNVWGR